MANQRRKLTNRIVKDIQPKAGNVTVYDTEVRGFAVVVSHTGNRSFYFIGRINGRARRMKLGSFPEMTCTEAREIARQTVVDASRGKDSLTERQVGRKMLQDLFDLYLTVHAKPNKRTWERDVKEFDRFWAKWKRKPLNEIRRGMISEHIGRLTSDKGPGAGHKARALLSKMFSIAVKHEWCEFNPVTGTDRPKFEARERYLKPDEVGRFFEAVEQLQRETSRDFIKMAVFTGARRSNLCEMRWDEIDLNRGTWTIPREKFKGKRTQTVPLIEPAVEILQRREEDKAANCPWVFPGGGKTGHIVEPKAAMERVKKLAGIKDLRFHDLRRSLGAWQNNAGISIRVIQQTLGHADIQTTAKHYSPNESELIRQSMQAAIDAAMGSTENAAADEG